MYAHRLFQFTILLAIVVGVFFFSYDVLFAAKEYTPLVKIPGLEVTEEAPSVPDFINRVYIITIVLGSLLGVIKLALAGVKYSMSGVVTDKTEAKNDILGVLLGLVVLLAPWVVLNTIYPNLLNLDITKSIQNPGLGDVLFERTGVDNTEIQCGTTPALDYSCEVALEWCEEDGREYAAENGLRLVSAKMVLFGPDEVDGFLGPDENDRFCQWVFERVLGTVTVDGDTRVAEYVCASAIEDLDVEKEEPECKTACLDNVTSRADYGGTVISGPTVTTQKSGDESQYTTMICKITYNVKKDE